MNKEAVKRIAQRLDLLGSRLRSCPDRITEPIQNNVVGKFLEATAFLLRSEYEGDYSSYYDEMWQLFDSLYRALMALFQREGGEATPDKPHTRENKEVRLHG